MDRRQIISIIVVLLGIAAVVGAVVFIEVTLNSFTF